MRHLVVQEPDGAIHIGVNQSVQELQPCERMEVSELALETVGERGIKIIHNEIVIGVWNVLFIVSLFKFYVCFFRIFDLIDVLFVSLTTACVHSERDVMLIPLLLHAFYSSTAGMALMSLNIWWEAVYHCICTFCAWLALSSYKIIEEST